MHFSETEPGIKPMPRMSVRTPVILLLLALTACALGYWAYGEYQKRELARAVSNLVKDASARLDEGLQFETRTAVQDDPQTLRRIDEHAKAVGQQLETLQSMSIWRDRALTYAAEDYLSTARQALRNQAAARRERLRIAESRRVLYNHMNYGNRHAAAWHRDALRLKDQLEKDYFNYRMAAESLDRLLENYPALRAGLAPLVDPGLLLDASTVASARSSLLTQFEETTAHMAQARRLAATR
jgi:hypothetical protein